MQINPGLNCVTFIFSWTIIFLGANPTIPAWNGSNTSSGWVGRDDGALHHLIWWIIKTYWGRIQMKQKMKSNILKCTFFMQACTETHTFLWASLQEGAKAFQPGQRLGNIVSDHLIGLAPDRQRSPRQSVGGPELTLQRHFSSASLRAEWLIKAANLEPQSFCLCHHSSLFNHLNTVFTSSRHKPFMHTLRATNTHSQAERGTKINPLDFRWSWMI